MHRAFSYAVSYFMTWIWTIVYVILQVAGVWIEGVPMPKWIISYWYVWNFFVPLQGMWTFLIFVHPKVMSKRRSAGGNISWFMAFRIVLWSAITGGSDASRAGAGNSSCCRSLLSRSLWPRTTKGSREATEVPDTAHTSSRNRAAESAGAEIVLRGEEEEKTDEFEDNGA